jgi:hypothetical protein
VSILEPQTKQTSQIENSLSSLKANQTAGTWQLVGVAAALKENKQRPAIRADVATFTHADSFAAPSGEPEPTETSIFRGENFKTQYYGGTNPTSLIAHVRCISLPVVLPLLF